MIIHVCIGSACYLKGSYDVITALQSKIDENNLTDTVVIKGAFCLGQCTAGVSVRIEDGPILSVSENTLNEFFETQVKGGLGQ